MRRGGGIAWLRLAIVGSWLAFTASVFVRPVRGIYVAWLDAGLYNVPFTLAVIAATVRARRDPAQRAAWRVLGIGLALFTAGNLWSSLVVGDSGTYPTFGDALWIASYAVAYAGIVLIVRSHVTRFSPATWVDGAVAGFGAAALAVAFAVGPLLSDTEGSVAVVATNLAYPLSDILLIILLVAAGTALRNRAHSWWLLVAGYTVLCAGDIVFLVLESTDSYVEGGPLDVTWPLGMALVGLAALAGIDRPIERADAVRRFTLPALFTASSVALLAYGQWHDLPWVAVALALAAIAAAVARTAMTVREVRSLASSRIEARTDDLTGLANRRAFVEGLDAALDAGSPLAVMIVDLDGFKEVNDSLGHDTGDDLLRIVAARLAGVFEGAVLARLGGDEFGVYAPLVPGVDPADAARRALAVLDEPVVLADLAVRVSASIGIARHPDHGRQRRELLRAADVAMYEAKRTRRNVVAYDRTRDPDTADRLRLVGELRLAIERRQLELHYQPTLDLTTGRIHGVEALVRWRRLDGSLCYPDVFIEPAERAGLIQQLSRAVLEQAIAWRAGLSASYGPLGLSVNVSGHDLLDEALPDHVAMQLAVHGIEPSTLTLEITETALVADLERARRSIDALRHHGVRISVDDFGVGYSSMAQLVGLAVDELKIDRSFVTTLASDQRVEEVVRAIVALGRALHLDLVAEGVEDEGALEVVRRLGCDVAQGYLVARPMPPDALVTFLGQHRAPTGLAR